MKLTALQQHVRLALLGMVMGITLSYIGFTDYSEVHKMFLFADLRLLLTFGGAVLVSAIFFNFLMDGLPPARKHLHPGTIPGSVLFGIGWAITGSCPSIALVQLGQGQAPAVFTVFGIFFGVWFYRQVHRRFFRWDSGSCN
jgi:uncharacterized membrane protein YedE/YeeE